MKRFEAWIFGWMRRPAPTGLVRRAAFWLFLFYLLCIATALLPASSGLRATLPGDACLLVLLPLCLLLFVEWLFGSFLWKVRNRLLVTYLLMGFAPLVLFATLALISLYVFSGQFAVFVATTETNAELDRLADRSKLMAMHLADSMARQAQPNSSQSKASQIRSSQTKARQTKALSLSPRMQALAPALTEVFVDGNPVTLSPFEKSTADRGRAQGEPTLADRIPSWSRGENFRGVIFDHGALYLRAIETEVEGADRVTVVSSMLIDEACAERIAAGLGRVMISPILEHVSMSAQASESAQASKQKALSASGVVNQNANQNTDRGARAIPDSVVEGGVLPPKKHFYDIPVSFAAPLATRDWQSGRSHHAYLSVVSRPSLLYARLFDYEQSFHSSLSTGIFIRDTLIALAAVFGLLELVAFYGAIRLNRTITRSIRDLYAATEAVDRGELEHRIPIKRRDQLASLSHSFNQMTTSLARLLEEQREKERLESELAIAHEVQANLFPRFDLDFSLLEVHGVCLPARSVSGDYYDFFKLGQTCLGLAVGDISGKGISAALLMATLHSAVRAYRLSAQQSSQPGATQDCDELFEDPAKILTLLNRHLYSSTPAEKYATLFLAHIDAQSEELTYANGGQNPPLLLRRNGQVERLDRGGTVVGLLESVHYEQAKSRFESGDLLIVYSDGVTEPENEFEEFGEERLLDLVRRHAHEPLKRISDSVMEALHRWIGSAEQPDDITLVLVRRK